MAGLPFDPMSLHFAVLFQLIVSLFANLDGFFGYNMVVFTIILFAYYAKPDATPMLTALIVVCTSILLDIIQLGIYGKQWGTLERNKNTLEKEKFIGLTKFCMALGIINMIVKPWTIYLTYGEYRQRGGDLMMTLRGDTAYTSVDDPPHVPSAPAHVPAPQAYQQQPYQQDAAPTYTPGPSKGADIPPAQQYQGGVGQNAAPF